MSNLERRLTRAFTRIELLIVTAIAMIGIVTFSDFVENAKYTAWVASCKANLKQFGLAIQTYRGNHQDAMPAHLQLLLPTLKSRGVSYALCRDTSTCRNMTGRQGYVYRFLEKPKKTDIICWDSHPHRRWQTYFTWLNRPNRNVLMADGRVKNMPEAEFQKLHLSGQSWILP